MRNWTRSSLWDPSHDRCSTREPLGCAVGEILWQMGRGGLFMASPKLVEPDRDEGAVRVETIRGCLRTPGSECASRLCRVVSTRPFAGAHELAQPASCELASIFPVNLFEPSLRERVRSLCSSGMWKAWDRPAYSDRYRLVHGFSRTHSHSRGSPGGWFPRSVPSMSWLRRRFT